MDARFLDALRARDADAARRLVRDSPGLALARAADGSSALAQAAYARLPTVVDALLEAGAVPDAFDAAILGDAPRVEALLADDPALVTRRSGDGWTLLHLAAHFGHANVAELLVRRHARVDAPATDMTSPSRSVVVNDLPGTDALANTPLHAAAAGGHARVALLLLGAGAPVDARDSGGHTPLMIAAAGGHAVVVDALLAHGADASLTSPAGASAADFARERGHERIAKRLAT